MDQAKATQLKKPQKENISSPLKNKMQGFKVNRAFNQL
jgi:hypothetical protein